MCELTARKITYFQLRKSKFCSMLLNEEHKALVAEMFSLMDLDGSGFITWEEHEATCKRHGLPLDKEKFFLSDENKVRDNPYIYTSVPMRHLTSSEPTFLAGTAFLS